MYTTKKLLLLLVLLTNYFTLFAQCPDPSNDSTPPTAVCQDITVQLDANGTVSITAADIDGGSFDNCGIASIQATTSSFDCGDLGPNTVSLFVIDTNGNPASCTATVTVVDIIDPVIADMPDSQTLNVIATTCGAVATWTAPTASDNCSVTLTSSHDSGDTFPVGSTTVTYTATDGSGNETQDTFTITVTDNEDPVIADCPADITQDSDAGVCEAVVTWAAPTASDNCSVTLTSDYSPGDTFPLGSTTVTYTATDAAGNTTTCTFDVIVEDNEDPVIADCPADITQDSDAGVCEAVVTWTAPTASDNCSVTLTSTHDSGDTFPVGSTTVTYTATDGNGQTVTCTFDVIIEDNEDPVIANCPADITQDSDAGVCEAVVTWAAPTASDNCAVTTFTSTHDSGDTFPVGSTTVTYTATDAAGNTTTCTFDVIVEDNEDPVIADCPADITQDSDAGVCEAVVTWAAPTASDNCAVTTFTSTHDSGDTFPVGSTTVTYTATDAAGNSTTCTFDVIVEDNEDPVIADCPADITQDSDAGVCEAVVTWAAPTASDNCAVTTFTSTHDSGDTFPSGTTTVTYTATDAAGNTTTCTFDVTVEDNEDPVIADCPADITQDSDAGVCEAVVTWAAPTASDNCSVTLTSDYSPGDTFPLGSTTVTYTATDAAGNTTTCTFDVIVEDNEDPVIADCPADITQDSDAGVCEAVVTWAAPTATDNCSVTLTSDYSPGDTFPLGSTTVTYTATDGNGQTVTCTFDVIIEDNEDPVIADCPADITQDSDAGVCEAVVTWTAPTASDNCAVTTFTSTHDSGDTFPVGSTTVTYTATDAAGNTTTCTFDVIVEDNEDPVIVDCPADITQDSDAGVCEAVVTWAAPTASDNCAVTTFTSTHDSGDTFPSGTTTVTYTATDAAGNTTTCTFDVIIADDEDPVIADCPADITQDSDAGVCEAVVTWAAPTASDNCAVTTFTSTHDSGDTFPLGSTTVTYTATDAAGNTTTCTFDVIVEDNEDPVIADCPADITQDSDAGVCEAVVTWTAPTASDNCSVTLTSDYSPGDTFPLGSTTVTYTATDGNGQTVTCTFDVIVEDNEDPVIADCPADITQDSDAGVCEAVVTWTAPTASDNCAVQLYLYSR